MSKKSLSKRVQELISTATPKQKALLVCKDWTDAHLGDRKPLLTEEETIALRDSLKTNDEKIEYNKWIGVYNVYREITPLFGIVYKEYQAVAERMLGYLKKWEAYDNEENHLITIYEELKGTGDKKAIDAYFKALSYLSFPDAKLVIAEDGYPEIDITKLYERIQEEAKEVYKFYSTAKAIVIVVDEYTKKTRSKDFRPDVMIESIGYIKEDYSQRVAPRYSRKLLKEKQEKGMRVTKDEIRRAVYPSYEEIEPSQEFLEIFRGKLKDIIASNGR
jgi:hypothetical protein